MNMNQADMICVDLKAKYKANCKPSVRAEEPLKYCWWFNLQWRRILHPDNEEKQWHFPGIDSVKDQWSGKKKKSWCCKIQCVILTAGSKNPWHTHSKDVRSFDYIDIMWS